MAMLPGFKMLQIPAGKFLMGSPSNEQHRFSDEEPQHEVTLKAFKMSETPITQAQWRTVANWEPPAGEEWETYMDPNPSFFQGDDHPVDSVSWDDTQEFCRRLSKITGKKYTLPSEAQWEYAARAGTTTAYYTGDTITSDDANFDDRANGGDYVGSTTPVFKYPPNPWGLRDMAGNVWEWCLDRWHDNYEGAPTDGSAWVE